MQAAKEFKADKLDIRIYDTRKAMGEEAAKDVGRKMKALLTYKEDINIIFAAAPSQNEFLAALIEQEGIDWSRINAFHMDEYIGIDHNAPQRFGNFLKTRIFSKVPFKSINYLNGNAKDIHGECKRYAQLLNDYPTDIVCMGIGENGHIAFNDPHVAFFDDPNMVKVVELDHKCRMQQVNDGCFSQISHVPTHAITLTIPALIKGDFVYCMVPGNTKCEAVFETLTGGITEKCPASILRKHDHSLLFCDQDSAKKLL